MNTIEALKKNEKPFGLMCGVLKRQAKKIGKKEFELYSQSNCWTSPIHGNWNDRTTYRLRHDYADNKVEFIKWDVYMASCDGFLYAVNGGSSMKLDVCQAYPDFVGFRYEDGTITSMLRAYKVDGSDDLTICVPDYENEFEVLTPTHALFKGESK